MDKRTSFPNLPAVKKTESRRDLSRREAIQWLIGSAGVGIAALPAVAENHPVYSHLHNASTLDAADAGLSAKDWAPIFLSSHQSQALAVLAERIIPGSSRAEVERFIDLLLSVDSGENQKRFLNSLSAFESEAIRRFHQPFVGCSEVQQNEILQSASAMKPEQSTREPDWGWFRLVRKEPSPDKVRLNLYHHLAHLKGWVSGAYYSSETGMRELGWTGESFFGEFPGCPHGETEH